MVLSDFGQGRELKAEPFSALFEVVHDALAVAFFVIVLPLVRIFASLGQQGVDQAGQLMGGRGDGLRPIEAGTQAAVIGAQGRLARTQGRGGQPQGLGRPVRGALAGPREDFAAGNLGARAQPEPGGEVLGALEAGQVGADFRHHFQCRRRIDAVDAGQIDAAHPEEVGPDIEFRGIPGPRAASILARVADGFRLQRGQHGFELLIALGQPSAIGIVEGHGLLQGKQMLVAPVAAQGLGNLRLARPDAHVLHLGELGAVPFARNDGAHDLLPGLADDVGNHVGQLDIHLRQGLLHVLDMARLVGKQHVPLPRHGAQGADGVLRSESAREQPEAHQLLQPLAVQHVGFAARDILDVPGIDQIDREAARFQEFEEGNPIDTGRFHGHRVNAAGDQPVGQPLQVIGETLEFPDRLVVPVRGHRHIVARRTDINPRRIRVGQFQNRSLAYRHGFLHDRHRNAAPVRVRRCTHSFKRDDRFHGLTNIADVTQDHANTRAGTLQWQIGLRRRGIPPYRSRMPNACFLQTPCGRKADYFANFSCLAIVSTPRTVGITKATHDTGARCYTSSASPPPPLRWP